ncbi:sigma-70 family RNA polymerase sigma factor [Streptomyces sp. NPDC088341]|uniref:RNA polymerase sigma factor n=1 Tax=Streptomyces sp. NPDC088341 TaxID=3154870 RepID=UPI003427FF65
MTRHPVPGPSAKHAGTQQGVPAPYDGPVAVQLSEALSRTQSAAPSEVPPEAPLFEEPTDAELARRGANGDQEAFTLLMSRYRAMIHATCLRIVGDADDAGDAVQETLIGVWRGLPGFRSDARFSTWLYRIAVNAALKEAGRQNSRPLPVEEIPERKEPVRSVADRVTDGLSVRRALALLPLDFRVAVVLRDCCGCEYSEIAGILGIPINTVKSRISRARQALADLLRPNDDPGEM